MRFIIYTTLLALLVLSTAHAKVFQYTPGNRLRLIEGVSESADLKVDLIRKAKHHIHIITFFWDESSLPERLAHELNAASARGVEIRILTTWVASVGTDFLGKGRNKLTQSSKSTFVFLPLTPGREFALTHSLHEKIFLVDGRQAIIGGRNISDSSFSGKDLEVLMEGPVVNQVQDHFHEVFDFLINRKIRNKCVSNQSPSCPEKLEQMKFSKSSSAYFPTQPVFEDGVEARILSHDAIIQQSNKPRRKKQRVFQKDDILDTVTKFDFNKLRAYNYFIIPTLRYKTFLEESLIQGRSIEMITNSLESAEFSSNLGYVYSLPEAKNLASLGMHIYQWKRNQTLNYVHQKVLIFDDEQVIIGSHNFVMGSTSVSNEIAVDIKSKVIASRLIDVFDEEKTNEAITLKVDEEFLDKEINHYKKLIKFLRKKFAAGIIHEIY